MVKNLRLLVLCLPRLAKRLIVMAVDAGLAVFAVWLAYYLRLGHFIPLWRVTEGLSPAPAIVLALLSTTPIFMAFGLYRIIFRYGGVPAIVSVTKAITVYGLTFVAVFTIFGVAGVPRTIGIIQPIILYLLVVFSRLVAQFWLRGVYDEHLRQEFRPRALIYGAGDAGRELAAALANSAVINIVGFLDDDAKLHGNQISGLPVYSPSDSASIIEQERVSEVLLAMPQISRRRRSEILQLLQGCNVMVRTLPSYSDLAEGRVTVNDIRELTVNDILGRDVVTPDTALMQRDIAEKTVLVTGAGGSIGSELCRQIVAQGPKKLLLLDHSECSLHAILHELQGKTEVTSNNIELCVFLGSVTDKRRMEQLLRANLPDTVFHAAAYKHVPLVEDNMFEGLKNNLFGTLTLSQVAIDSSVKKFVLISTDKAVRPTNIMGASKRLSELVLQALSITQAETIFAIVRFGNVLESSGSVVPLFREQIESGGPVTVTHRDVTRYFMTISESAELVIQAGAMTTEPPEAGQSAPVYHLDMGKPVRIYELARQMIDLSGLTTFDPVTGDGDIEISITGLRPGEKLYEELLINDDARDSSHPKIKFANEDWVSWCDLQKSLVSLAGAIEEQQSDKTLQIVSNLVAGFYRRQTDKDDY